MAKLRIDPTNPNTFEKMKKAGRGAGEGAFYKPWLTVQDLSSRGQSSRILGWRTGRRLIHLFSKLERDFFYSLEWDPLVEDYREQFLLDPTVTQAIADKAGIVHPTSPATGRLFPMTTDFIVKKSMNGKPVYSARAVKPFSDVGPGASPRRAKRIAEKLWIEREYWKVTHIEGIPVDWALVTENDFDPVLSKNVRAIHDYYHLEALSPLTEADVCRVDAELSPQVKQGGEALSRLASACDKKLGFAKGKSLAAARHLIATRKWLVDLSVPFDTCKPVAFEL